MDPNDPWWYAKTDYTKDNDWVDGKGTECLAVSDYTDTFSLSVPLIWNNNDSYNQCTKPCTNKGAKFDGQWWFNKNSRSYECQCKKEYKTGTSVPFGKASCASGSSEAECVNNALNVGAPQRSLYNQECGEGPPGWQNNVENGRLLSV